MPTLESLRFDNSYARLPQPLFSHVEPTPLPAPYPVSCNADAAALIGVEPRQLHQADGIADYFSGNRPLPGSQPIAMLYAGHQFGHYVPQLGDGRAILLGEVINDAGERWDIQLKGAGITPYSRSGDGRAVLRSTIREYLCSEAMHGLGIPTSRALCIIGSDEEVYRESIETAAVLTRLAPSHVRFGSFEALFYRERVDTLTTLADYVIDRHYPDLSGLSDRHARFFDSVVTDTARLMAAWQSVGFAHGVMNTDNMSILGLTFDYGPYGFLDSYDPGFICNHSDHHGRYAFDRQPNIGLWNLTCLAQALSPLIEIERLRESLSLYESTFTANYAQRMRAKLGLAETRAEDGELASRLLALMQADRVDYTNLFRSLGDFRCTGGTMKRPLRDHFIDREGFDAWAGDYRLRLLAEGSEDIARRTAMNRVNPKYILRNYLAETAIRKARDERDYSETDRLLAILKRPFDEQPEHAAYTAPPPAWASEISVSCSS